MKHILIIFDGMADNPSDFINNQTPMCTANTPNIDKLAKHGKIGLVKTTPDNMQPGSDVTNLGILGYDPTIYYQGRASIEAASLGIKLNPTDVAYRTNLVSTDGKTMLDSSADHITDQEAGELIDFLNSKLACDNFMFYKGVSYRNIMVMHNGSMNVNLYPPYKFIGESLESHKPKGDFSDLFWELIVKSYDLLNNHPINIKRREKGLLAANQVWFWAEGRLADFPSFKEKFGMDGAVIAAVDLIKGLGKMTNLKVLNIPGATGYIDTNYENKAKYAIDALKDNDFVWVHIEAPDEAGHEKNKEEKIKAIEKIDNIILKSIIDEMDKSKEPYKILIMPDHPTPISTGSHTDNPVPYLLYDSTNLIDNNIKYNEVDAKEGIYINNSIKLMPMLMNNNEK